MDYKSIISQFKDIFQDKVIIDDRIPSYKFKFLNDKTYGLLVPKHTYLIQALILLILQTIVAVILSSIIYHFIVLPKKINPSEGRNFSSSLLGFGVILPFILYEPIWIDDFLGLENTCFKMVVLALPSTLSLRCLEAMFGCTPEGPKKNMKNYIIYASCLVGSSFDATNQQPLRTTISSFLGRLRDYLLKSLVLTVLLSLLSPSNYSPFETKTTSNIYDFKNLFSIGSLLNNFVIAFFLSSGLSHTTVSVGLLYNIFYQVQTIDVVHNPFFTSKSPSDFWGRKWNMFIHSGLKGAIYKPSLMHFSKSIATFATFVASGLLHEYIILYMYRGTTLVPSHGKNMLFFGWNAILLIMESIVGRSNVFKWIGKTLPQPLVSVLVVLTALPLGHLFLSDWIEFGHFRHVELGNYMIVSLKS